MKNTIKTLINKCKALLYKAPQKLAAIAVGIEAVMLNTTNVVYAAGTTFDPKKYALWEGTWKVIDVVLVVLVVAGAILLLVGIVMLIMTKFNGQEMNQAFMFGVVGIALIAGRFLLAEPICKFVIGQMYPNAANTPEEIYNYFAENK